MAVVLGFIMSPIAQATIQAGNLVILAESTSLLEAEEVAPGVFRVPNSTESYLPLFNTTGRTNRDYLSRTADFLTPLSNHFTNITEVYSYDTELYITYAQVYNLCTQDGPQTFEMSWNTPVESAYFLELQLANSSGFAQTYARRDGFDLGAGVTGIFSENGTDSSLSNITGSSHSGYAYALTLTSDRAPDILSNYQKPRISSDCGPSYSAATSTTIQSISAEDYQLLIIPEPRNYPLFLGLLTLAIAGTHRRITIP